MTASTVAQYLAALPADRRAALSAVRKAINENLPDGYEEGMQFGMIGWYVPLSVYPAGYGENPKVPLSFVALASQKSGMVLHFLCFYGHPTLSTWFTSEYKKSGKKLDMGKGCVRFKSLEDLALDVVGRTVARVSVEEHMASYHVTSSPTPISGFQPFSCRPSGDGSGEKLQALLSQREVMLQLPLHSRPQILRWTCACKVPRIFPPGFDQA